LIIKHLASRILLASNKDNAYRLNKAANQKYHGRER